MNTPDIQYIITIENPHQHILHVSLIINGIQDDYVDVSMPSWTPGSYMIREYARNIISLYARTGPKKLRVSKASKNHWRVNATGVNNLKIDYTVYANELTVRTSLIDADHAMLNGASVFLYPVTWKDSPSKITIIKPAAWKRISTGLDKVVGKKNTYTADSYDALIDSPIAIGNQQIARFTISRVPHEFAVFGKGNFDLSEIVKDTKKILTAEHDMFQDIPYSRYVFVLHAVDNGYGGLEHRNSTHIMFNRFNFQERKDYIRFLALVSHEFFHTYNVKRIRPKGLGPFKYDDEFYTDLHWVTEGVTSYYDNHFLLRSGVISPDEYLELLEQDILRYCNTPGRHNMSVKESSFDQWIKLYRPNENSVNAVMSYYLKGSFVALALDMSIRRTTEGSKCLDDAYRHLWTHYKKTGKGFSEKEFIQICENVAGSPLTDVWELLDHKGDLDFNSILKTVGLQTKTGFKEKKDRGKSWFGFDLDSKTMKVTKILSDGPAYDTDLNVNDELLAMDGFRLRPDNFMKMLETALKTRKHHFLISRYNDIRTVSIRPRTLPENQVQLMKLKTATPLQKVNYRNWLRSDWDGK